jgi:SAM-dependent methyltransferase
MSLADEYRQQYRWRSWSRAYDLLPLVPGDIVLDLGCAIGDHAADLAARGGRVIGIDANAELLAVARARGIADAEFRLTDLAGWSEPRLVAAGLWCSFVPAYFPDLAAVLRRWTRAVRPGGWVMLIEVDNLFGHEPMSATTRREFERFYDEAFARGRYDFRMGRKLATHARSAALEVVHEFSLPDLELAFDGEARSEVLEAWARRFHRMPALSAFFGAEFEAIRSQFLATLASSEHCAVARVHGVMARVAGG